MVKLSIGIDIGGTNTVIGVVNQDGKILLEDSLPTPPKKLNPRADQQVSDKLLQNFILEISRITNSLLTKINLDYEVVGIGIGAPNANYNEGTIEFAPNLPFTGKVPFCKILAEKFPDMPKIRITNDANAAALGEKAYGGARNMDNFVMFTLGTGVGSGLFYNGDVVYGVDGFAGECGHNTIVADGRLCGCGGRGHLEAYCSAPGMKRTAFELLLRDHAEDSLLSAYSYKEMTSKHIFEAAVQGDKIALEVFEITGKYLGMALATTVHHLSPEAIFLFGGPVAAGDLILKPIKESLENSLLPVFRKRNIPILVSELDLGHAAILGASALVWNN
ncbi:MAG: ROK family protein [Bacteroidales bacterium]|nr:ROK family protein [Bacteroidales bacterium]